jgi:hypothetical protein
MYAAKPLPDHHCTFRRWPAHVREQKASFLDLLIEDGSEINLCFLGRRAFSSRTNVPDIHQPLRDVWTRHDLFLGSNMCHSGLQPDEKTRPDWKI